MRMCIESRLLSESKLRLLVLAGFAVPLLSACLAVVAPAVKTFAAAFGGQLISTASHNYSKSYGDELEHLLLTLMPESMQQNKGGNQGTTQVTYENDGWGGSASSQGWKTDQAQNQGVSGGQDWGDQGWDDQSWGQVAQNNFADGQAQVAEQQNFTYQEYDSSAQSWSQPQAIAQVPNAVRLEADVLVQRAASRMQPTPIQDGETLFSVPGNPVAGDRIKVSFKANCACYIYVIGVDSTGYVASIFPDQSSALGNNPVQAGRQYTFPEGADWYGLDEYTGVENVYFIASHDRRLDIERAVKKLADQPRNVNKQSYQPVEVAAIPPVRGLVRVTAKEAVASFVQTSAGQQASYTPTSFMSKISADLVINRWFHHK